MKTLNTYIIASVFAIVAIFCSCKDSVDNDYHISLSSAEMNINVGESATITVSTKSTFETYLDENIALCKVSGNELHITAVSVGSTTLRVSNNHSRALCKITVTNASGGNDSSDSSEKTAEDLTIRCITPGDSLNAESIGILYSKSTDSNFSKYLFADIDKGSHVSLQCRYDGNNIYEATINDNGAEFPASANVVYSRNDTLHIKITCNNNLYRFIVDR